MGIKRWILPASAPDAVEALRGETGYSNVLCTVLYNRGYRTGAEIAAFLENDTLDNPFLLADMDKAVDRVTLALEQGARIAVYGDYDCDGITSTALLTSYLQSVGADVFYYIPDREKEGYGLNMAAVDTLHAQGTNLIITVDNGVSAHQEIAYASSLGMDVVITDHHTPRDTLPQAVAVVNPHRSDCPSTFKELAGVGVAFKLVCALEEEDGTELMEYYSDLVMLGTVADVVSLTGENRTIVSHGLQRLLDTERPGLQALLEFSGAKGRALTSESVAFGVIPRLNAAGRMGCVDDAIELLLTDDVRYAKELAQSICDLNEQRKKTEAEIMKEIEGILRKNPQILSQRLLLLEGDGWPHGVVGIVAAKIVEKYGKPTILFSVEKGVARGSGRSVEGFSLIQAISSCSEYLMQYGGHTLAAGLSLPTDKLCAFKEQMLDFARSQYPVMPVPALEVDCSIPAGMLQEAELRAMSLLEPFGAGNRQPLYHLSDMLVEGIYPTGDKKHIRIRLSGGGASFYAVFFRKTQKEFAYQIGDRVDLVANLSVGEYNGKTQISVKICDLRMAKVPQQEVLEERDRYSRHTAGMHQPEDKEALLPGREDFALVYKYLRRCGEYSHGFTELYYRLMGAGIGYSRMRVVLDVLEELGLIAIDPSTNALRVSQTEGKVDLSASEILSGLRE